MTSVERLDTGEVHPGSQARVKQPGQRAKVWTVITVEPQRRFVWRARVFGTDMAASHELQPTVTGTTNTLTIDISGPGTAIVGRLVAGPIRKALATENAGFKRVAEAGAERPGDSPRPVPQS